MNEDNSSTLPYIAYERIGKEFHIPTHFVVKLSEIFHTISHTSLKGNNVLFMKAAIRQLMDTEPGFHYYLRQNEVTKLVSGFIKEGLIVPRSYPKKRLKASINWRQSLTEQRVFSIISNNPDPLQESIRREQSLDAGYRSFAIAYNNEHPEEYFPIKWKSLSEQVKNKIKDLFQFGKGNIRALDTAGLRFASREEIYSHTHFRDFIVFSLIEGRKQGIKNFHIIMRQALSYWYRHFYIRTGLRVPVTLHARAGVQNTLKIHMNAASSSPKDILISLGIDPKIWTEPLSKNTPQPRFRKIIASSVFTYTGTSLERQ